MTSNKRRKIDWNEVNDVVSNEKDIERLTTLLSDRVLDASPPVAAAAADADDASLCGDGQGNGLDPIVDDPTAVSVLHGLLNRDKYNDDARKLSLVVEAIRTVLKLGCDPKARGDNGSTALHILAKNDYINGSVFIERLDVVLSFVDKSEWDSYINALDENGRSAIAYAVQKSGGARRVNKLLDLSANPHVGVPTNCSILYDIVSDIWDETSVILAVRRLLQLGCDARSSVNGYTALHVLVKGNRHLDPFYEHHTRKIMEIFLSSMDESERTGYMNAVDRDGKSALDHAAEIGCFARVMTLLDLGADPCAVDPTGSSILRLVLDTCKNHAYHYKRYDWQEKVTKRLLLLGCDPKIKDSGGHTALHILVKNNDRHLHRDFNLLLDILLSSLGDSDLIPYMNETDSSGRSAIFDAAPSRVVPQSLGLLLGLGADPNIKDNSGQTVLHVLTKEPNFETKSSSVSLLVLQHKADTTIEDHQGYMPLQ